MLWCLMWNEGLRVTTDTWPWVLLKQVLKALCYVNTDANDVIHAIAFERNVLLRETHEYGQYCIVCRQTDRQTDR